MTDPNKIFLGGVAFVTTEDGLRQYLSKYGTVADVVIMKDKYTGRSRGFGFATFTEPEAAAAALADTHTIDGRTVEVKNATPRGTNGVEGEVNAAPVNAKKIFVGGLAPSVTNATFKEYFEKYGQVEDAIVMTDRETERSRGFGFITFVSAEAVEAAMAETNHELEGKVVEVKSAHAKQKDGAGYGRGRYGKGGRGRGKGRGGRGKGFFGGRGYGRVGYPNGYENYGGRGGAQGQYGYGGYGYGAAGAGFAGAGGFAGYDQYKGYMYGGAMYGQQFMQGYGAGFPGAQGGDAAALGQQGPFDQALQNGAATANGAAGGEGDGASDWIECYDPTTNRPYYANQKTRQTSWTAPAGYTPNQPQGDATQPQQDAQTPAVPENGNVVEGVEPTA